MTTCSTIMIPMPLWCRLCDALSVPPETPMEQVITKAETLATLASRKETRP